MGPLIIKSISRGNTTFGVQHSDGVSDFILFIQRINIDQVSDTRSWETLIFVHNDRPQYGHVFDNHERFILTVVRIVIQFPFYNIITLEVKRDGALLLHLTCLWCVLLSNDTNEVN